jgi:diaminopimelate epimerase
MRVWERGCGETFACGTGACAAVAAAMRQKKCGASVLVRMTGGELLVQYDRRHGHLYLTGPAEEICHGKFG